jgi:acetyltransferase-like isoleucine patch superfamily enzyme
MPRVKIHPTALVEPGVEIGEGTSVWDAVHIRGPGTTIGTQCIIGEKTYVAYGVSIGSRVKINAMVYVCTAVTIENGVMISAGTIFTNDVFPRATTPDLHELLPSDPSEETQETWVRQGATIGAGCVIGSNLEIGAFAMVGMGSVVTRSVPAFALVVGNPARVVGFVCRCGQRIARCSPDEKADVPQLTCKKCGLPYRISRGHVAELNPPF